MPLRHSPPASSASPKHGQATAPAQPREKARKDIADPREKARKDIAEPQPNTQHSSLEVDQQCLSDDSLSSKSNVSHRPKRKRTNTIELFMTEMREMFSDFKSQQDTRMEKMYSVMEEIKTQNSEIRSSIEFLSTKYDALVERVNELKEENLHQQNYIQTLENKLENFERSTRATCLEIKNIPVIKTETKSSLVETVTKIGTTLNLNIQPSEIKDVFRINTRNPENKTIIVELVSVLTKNTVLKAYKTYNRGPQKLTTETMKISGPSKPIFITENLTAKMKRLFYLARVFANSNDYKYCWSTSGRIYLRERDGSPFYTIKDESDLDKLVKDK